MAAAVDLRPPHQRRKEEAQEPKPRGAAAIRPAHQKHLIGRQTTDEAMSGSSKRSELRGMPPEEQRAAVLPPAERLQRGVKRHVARQPPVSAGYQTSSSAESQKRVIEFNNAAGRAADGLDLACSALKGAKNLEAAKNIGMLSSGLKAVSGASMGAQVTSLTSSVIAMADAFGREDYQAGFDLLVSVYATTLAKVLLAKFPQAQIALASLDATYGATWPTQLAHHLAGTHEEKPIEGHAYLHQP